MPDELCPDPLFLKRGKDTDRPQAEKLFFLFLIGKDIGFCIHDMARQFPPDKGYKGEFGNKFRNRPDLMDDEMFIAAGLVDIPEGFPGKVFCLKVVSRFFASKCDLHEASFVTIKLCLQISEKRR